MALNPLDHRDHLHLASLLAPERCSREESVLEEDHSNGPSRHPVVRPELIVWPETAEEIAAVLKYADLRRLPVGVGSNNAIPVSGGIVLNMARMKHMELRENDLQIDAQPGVPCKEMNQQLHTKGLFFPPDPGGNATIGSMIAGNGGGVRAVRYGPARDYVQRLKMVLADGRIIETGHRASKSFSGHDLLHLFIGSEGTLGIVAEATLRLACIQESFTWALATFPTIEDAGRAVLYTIRSEIDPAVLELLAPECVEVLNVDRNFGLPTLPTLVIELHGSTRRQLTSDLRIVEEIFRSEGCMEFKRDFDQEERDRLLDAVQDLKSMIIRQHSDRKWTSTDLAVPISAYPEMVAVARRECQIGPAVTYTFGHAGDGHLHMLALARPGDDADWRATRELSERLAGMALKLGGTSTGAHGAGTGRNGFMRIRQGGSLAWTRKIKELFDPNGILNPGKMFPENPQGHHV